MTTSTSADLAFWRPIVAALDPYRAIQPGDPEHRYVPRPDSPLTELKNVLLFNLHNPRKVILAGHRGSGKSSELAKLAGEIGDQAAVIWVRAESTFDMFNVGHTELLIAIGAAIDDALGTPEQFRALAERLSTIVREQGGTWAGTLDTQTIRKFGIDLSLSLKRETRQRLEVPPVLGGIVDGVNAIVAAGVTKANRPLLVLVDGIDRLDAESARRMFVHNQLLAQLNCHIVFAVPLPLYTSISSQIARGQSFVPMYLPNIKLHERGRSEPHPPGFDFMERVIARRLQPIAPDLFERQALNQFIEMSGGVTRELLTLAEKACYLAPPGVRRIERGLAERAVHEYRLEKWRALPFGYYFREMRKVHAAGKLTDRREKDREGREFIVCDELIEGLYVLQHTEGGLWYDVHPLMLSVPEREAANGGGPASTELSHA